jgi:hypothetical protein
MKPQPPFSNSYVVPGAALIAGEYPSSPDEIAARKKLAALLDVGVGKIIDLTTPDDPLAPYDLILERLAHNRTVARHHMPIRDLGICEIEEMVHILDSVDTALSEGQTVYVHCWGGVGERER